MQIRILIAVFTALIISSCIEEYHPKLDTYDELIVIDGNITDEAGPYTITVSKSTTVYDEKNVPVTGAEVIIADNKGNSETLTETTDGRYQTSESGIQGHVGNSYRLTVIVNGKTYQSGFEMLNQAVRVDSIYSRVEQKSTLDGDFEGLQFYVNTAEYSDNNKFFLWQAYETYKYKSDLKLNAIFYGLDSVVTFPAASQTICWRTNKIYDVYTESAKKIRESSIKNYPVNFVATNVRQLSERYSLQIKQLSISEEAYRFWSEVESQNTASGSLYTKQPYLVKGNIQNIDNPNEIVLGYFMAAGVSSKRIFVDRPTLIFTYPICEPSVDAYRDMFQDYNPIFPKYAQIVQNEGGETYGLANLDCFICDAKGGTQEKPDFWID